MHDQSGVLGCVNFGARLGRDDQVIKRAHVNR
jgi:hypothetical protein